MSEVVVPGIFPARPDAPPSPPHPPTSDTGLAADALVREVCANAGPVRYVGPRTVRGPLELQSRDFSHRLELRDITFEDLVDLRDTRFRKTVDLRGCTFRGGLRMEGTVVAGTLLMNGATVGALARDRRNRAARLSLLKVGGHLLARGLVAHGGIDLTRAAVRGHLDLSSFPDRRTRCAGSLVLNVARVGGDVRLNAMLLDGDLHAEGARVRANFSAGPLRDRAGGENAAVLEVTYVRGMANLSGSRIRGEMSFVAARVDQGLTFQAAEIHGGVFCRTALGRQPEIGGELRCPAARILATLDLSGARIGRDVFMEGATVEGTVFLDRGQGPAPTAQPTGPPGRAAPARSDLRTHVQGTLMMGHVTVHGSIRAVEARLEKGALLAEATVSGAVTFSRATVGGSIDLAAARIARGFYCRCVDGVRPQVAGSIKGKAAQIGGGVFLSGAAVKRHVIFAEARVEGAVAMCAGCHSPRLGDGGEQEEEENGGLPAAAPPTDGTAAPRATTIGGRVDFGHATVAGALKMAGVQAGAMVLEGATVTGLLDLTGARIGQSADEAPPAEPDAEAMLRVAGKQRNVVDATGLRLLGAAYLYGVRIAGDLNLQCARLESGIFCGARCDDDRLVGERPVVGGSVVLGSATILSEADFRAAWIAGDLSLERATVDGRLRCRLVEPSGPDWREHLCTHVRQLNLRNCTVDYLDLQGLERRGGEAVPAAGRGAAQQVSILLEGCRFEELSVPSGEEEKDYLFLFRGQEGSAFRQSSFVRVEQWLREHADDDAAEGVYRLMRHRRRAAMRSGRQRFGDWLVCALRAASMHFQSLMLASVLVYGLSVAVFRSHGSVVAQDTGAPAPASWSTTDALLTAAQVHLPMVSLPGKPRWEPARRPIAAGRATIGVRYDAYAAIISLLSYIVVPLVIGGIATTWLRRGKSTA